MKRCGSDERTSLTYCLLGQIREDFCSFGQVRARKAYFFILELASEGILEAFTSK
jgi:hypothetical protein